MTTEEAQQSTISQSEVAAAALEILREEGAHETPVFLSRLGTRLSAHFRVPIRSVLGSTRLGAVLTDALGPKIKFEGQGATLAAMLTEGSDANPTPLRFDPVIWAAFSKPITVGNKRYLRYARPFEFSHDPSELRQENVAEIDPALIASPLLPKVERERVIIHNIDQWCAQIGVQPATLTIEKSTVKSSTKQVGAMPGDVLRRFIEAVPESERSKHNLPLDLIYILLNR